MPGYDSGCCFRASGGGRARVVWEITTACNLSCGFCHARPPRCEGRPRDELVAGLRLIAGWHTRGVIVTGGEPLVRDDCLDLVDAAAGFGLDVDLCTNATLIDDAVAARLARALSEISVSLDSARPDLHDRLRGQPGAWRRAIRGIEALSAAGLEIHAIALACDETIPALDETVRLFADLRIHSVTLLGPVAVPGANPTLRLTPGVRAALVADLPRLRAVSGRVVINTKRVTRVSPADECPAGGAVWGIDAAGNLCPCILMRGRAPSIPLRELGNCSGWAAAARRLSWRPAAGVAACGE